MHRFIALSVLSVLCACNRTKPTVYVDGNVRCYTIGWSWEAASPISISCGVVPDLVR